MKYKLIAVETAFLLASVGIAAFGIMAGVGA